VAREGIRPGPLPSFAENEKGGSDFVTCQVDEQLVPDFVISVHRGLCRGATVPGSDHLCWSWPTEAESLRNFLNGAFSPGFIGIKDWIDVVGKGKE
jgi:hypothetical protein